MGGVGGYNIGVESYTIQEERGEVERRRRGYKRISISK